MRLAVLAAVALVAGGPDPHLHSQTRDVTARSIPEVMLMLDVSSAMGAHLDEVRSALDLMLSTTATDVAWGLSTFPAAHHSTCGDPDVDVLVQAPHSGDARTSLAAHTSDVIARLSSL